MLIHQQEAASSPAMGPFFISLGIIFDIRQQIRSKKDIDDHISFLGPGSVEHDHIVPFETVFVIDEVCQECRKMTITSLLYRLTQCYA